MLLCNQNCDIQFKIESEYAKGKIASYEGKIDDAEVSFIKSYKFAEEIDGKRFQLENIAELAKIYIKQEKYFLARYYLNKAIKTISKSSYNDVHVSIYEQFYSLYNHIHDFKNASKYQEKYIKLRDSLYGEELTQNLMAVQTEYEQRENKAKIESQNKVLVLKEEIISRQNILSLVTCAAILLLALLILVQYKNYKQKMATNIALEQKVKDRTKELETNYELIQKAYQKQNHFIIKTISDIKSPLSTMRGLCTLGTKEVLDTKAQHYIEQISETADQLISLVNKLSDKAVN